MPDISSCVALSDALMAQALQTATGEVLVVVNGFTAAVATRAKTTIAWTPIARGDFGEKTAKAAKKLSAAKRLYWQKVTHSPLAFVWSAAMPIEGTYAVINTWIADAKAATGGVGRGLGLSTKVENAFGLDAKWRCQFTGCGKDLMKLRATSSMAKSSYFAHIIASSPTGPRGSQLLSHALAHDVNNYMLLCDECHRRIDREDPDRFTIDVLRKMRRDSLIEVDRVLDSLQHRDAIPVAFMGNITGISFRVDWQDVEEGLWTRKLSMAEGQPYTFLDNQWVPHEPHSEYYWKMLLYGLGTELPQLRKLLTPIPGALEAKHFAVLPLHSASVLVLAGRLFGEAVSAAVLQHRRQFSKGQWSLGEEDGSAEPAHFKLVRHREPVAGDTEACLLIALNYTIGAGRLPRTIHDSGFKLPALEITADQTLSFDILDRPENLHSLSFTINEALRVLHDEWHVKKIHLVVSAPSSAAFKFGQKLQARSQLACVCYESEFGDEIGVFKPTIEVAGHGVRAAGSKSWLGLV